MKQRIVSGVFIAVITVLGVVLGGYVLSALCLFIGLFGAYELVKCINGRFNLLLYTITGLSILCLFYFFEFPYVLGNIILLLIVLFSISIFDNKCSIENMSVLFLMTILLGCSVHFIKEIEGISKWLLGYVVVISYLTDVFALFVGIKFGKHKLNERVSPKKTIEGAVGGWLLGGLISLVYAYVFNFFGLNIAVVIIGSIFLPIISQIGDLAYSLIKRHYNIKDFSKLIPGHGGILDRMDSLTFCVCFLGILLMMIGR